jgi:hypothetical protein
MPLFTHLPRRGIFSEPGLPVLRTLGSLVNREPLKAARAKGASPKAGFATKTYFSLTRLSEVYAAQENGAE